MGIKKIAKHLQDLLTETEGKRKKNTDAVSKLVRKLEKKKLKLNAKLAAAGAKLAGSLLRHGLLLLLIDSFGRH